jgi:acyl-CoA synthetase (AMP-forming)/AMP-acid ligase II
MDRIVHRENLAHYRRLLVERAGRVDDVINVSGHPMSTAEVESALVVHPKVSEAAVVGYPHDIKGPRHDARQAGRVTHPGPSAREVRRAALGAGQPGLGDAHGAHVKTDDSLSPDRTPRHARPETLRAVRRKGLASTPGETLIGAGARHRARRPMAPT